MTAGHDFMWVDASTAGQGRDMGRPGSARVEVMGPPDAITGVRVGGSGVVTMNGKVRF